MKVKLVGGIAVAAGVVALSACGYTPHHYSPKPYPYPPAPSATTSAPTTTPSPTTEPPTTSTPVPSGLVTIPGNGDSLVLTPMTPGSCHFGMFQGEPLPDSQCTPGAVASDVTQANIQQTICVPGYSSSVRPPASLTDKFKYDIAFPAYGYTGSGSTTELDHLVSLELGGASVEQNLWPEPKAATDHHGGVNNDKDAVENRAHTAVCDGAVPLATAQQMIASNWVEFSQYLASKGY